MKSIAAEPLSLENLGWGGWWIPSSFHPIYEVRGLETGLDDLPTSGVLGMNFMRQAIKKKREEAKGGQQS